MDPERQLRKPETGLVSLVKVKESARKMLPVNSTARSIILAEKDVLPSSEAIVKLEILDRLLSSELGI
jgi:hypothetical protein